MKHAQFAILINHQYEAVYIYCDTCGELTRIFVTNQGLRSMAAGLMQQNSNIPSGWGHP